MTTVISISAEARAAADALIRDGRATSFDHVIAVALDHDPDGWVDVPLDFANLSAENRAAVEEGMADIQAGRVHPAEEVFAELRARIDTMRRQ